MFDMKRITDFLKNSRHAVIWTATYIFIMWAILRGLFNFDMFSWAYWHRLMRAELHGFGGFVFGILILAAVPMYIATTTIVIRNKAQLFTIPIPGFIKKIGKLFTAAPISTPPANTSAPKATTTETDKNIDTEPKPVEKNMPAELRGAFARARDHIERIPVSQFDLGHTLPGQTSNIPNASEATLVPADDIPLPSDFDFDDTTQDAIPTTMPTFTDISFDNTPIDTPSTTSENDAIISYLNQHDEAIIKIENDVIITPHFAIVSHTDNDFWVADNEFWFAAGKQKPSPVVAAQNAATAHSVSPIVYLASNNIMDIDNLRQTWTDNGIMIIRSLDELPVN